MKFFLFSCLESSYCSRKNFIWRSWNPHSNSRMEIVWQQSFYLFLCNTNTFIFRKFMHWISFDTSWNLHSFVIVSSLSCVVLSEVILPKIYIKKFILRIRICTGRRAANLNKVDTPVSKRKKKNATPIEKWHSWGVSGVLRETPEFGTSSHGL